MVDLVLYKTTLRDLMRPKRLIVCLFLVAVPVLLAVLFRVKVPIEDYKPETIYNTLESGLVFGFVLTILSVVFGTGVLAQEIEQKTIVYILTRPVARWRIMFAKYLSAVTMITLVVWAASLTTAVVVFGPSGLMAESKSSYLNPKDITDISGLVTDVKTSKVQPVIDFATNSPIFQSLISFDEVTPAQIEASRNVITEELNRVISSGINLAKAGDWKGVAFSSDFQSKSNGASTPSQIAHVNRLLFSELFPERVFPVRSPMQLLVKDFLVLPIGALAYGALFLLLATLLNRPLMWGLVFAFGWESWVPTMPGNFQRVSLMSYLRTLAPHPQQDTDQAGLTSLLSAISSSTISVSLAITVLVMVIVVCLGASLALFSTNEFVPREDAE